MKPHLLFSGQQISFRFFNHFGWKGAIQRSLLLRSVGKFPPTEELNDPAEIALDIALSECYT